MHPGPINRGVEIDPRIADGERSVILDQVEAGVAVRMAVLERGRPRRATPQRARAMKADAPLGVFDSGLGGLTVVRALREALPGERIVYLGDTARVPYGTKGRATVVKYALACARHLVARDVKAIVIACNTVSAVAPERLRVELDIPVLEVIEPGRAGRRGGDARRGASACWRRRGQSRRAPTRGRSRSCRRARR